MTRKADLDGPVCQMTWPLIARKDQEQYPRVRRIAGSVESRSPRLRGLPISSKMLAQDAIRNIADEDQPIGISSRTDTTGGRGPLLECGSMSYCSARIARPPDRGRRNHVPSTWISKERPFRLEIGRELGGKRHTTVIHSVEKIESLVLRDANFHRVVSDLMDGLCK